MRVESSGMDAAQRRLMFTNMRVGAVVAKFRPVKVVIGGDEFTVSGARALACRLAIRIEWQRGIKILSPPTGQRVTHPVQPFVLAAARHCMEW